MVFRRKLTFRRFAARGVVGQDGANVVVLPDSASFPAVGSSSARLVHVVLLAVTGGLLVLAAAHWISVWVNQPVWRFYLGRDLQTYAHAAQRWLHDGGFYLARQLEGPYTIQDGDILYPPTTLILLVPFTILPSVVWWLAPATMVTFATLRHRPAVAAWPVLSLLFLWPPTLIKVLTGNPVIWSVGALALGTLYAWPSVFAGLKLSLGPFAFFGIWRRTWWVALAGLAALSLLFAPLWPDYMRVILDSRNPAGAAYSLDEVPLMLFPIVVWLARTT